MQKAFFLIGIVAVLGGSLCVADPAPSASADQTASQGQKLVKVAHLNNADQVQQFLRNVALVEAQRKAAVELKASIEKESDSKKAKELRSQLDALMKMLNQNNAAMVKTYGFSLLRNYTVVYDSATIYLQLTPDEAKKLEQQKQQNKGAKE